MADDKPAPSDPWEAVFLVVAIIAGSLILIWQQGRLKSLDVKNLLVPPPVSLYATTSPIKSGDTYATQQLENSYRMNPNPVQTTTISH